jgi:hypothetical protein
VPERLFPPQGVRAAHDASSSVGPAAFSTFARVPLARPEIAAVGWARSSPPHSGRGRADGSRSASRRPPASRSPRPARASGARPPLSRRSTSAPTLARRGAPRRPYDRPAPAPAPIRLPGDGRIGVYAFVPVFAKGLPPARPLSGATPSPARRGRRRHERARPRRDDRAPQGARCPCLRRADGACRGPHRHRNRSGRARRPNLACLARPRLRLPARTDRNRLRRPGADAPARRCLAAAAPARGLRSGARNHFDTRADELRSRTRTSRVHDRRGAAHPQARRRRQ